MATTLVPAVREEVETSADPGAARAAVARILEARPDLTDRFAVDRNLVAATVAVAAASPYLTRLCVSDPAAIEVLADLDTRRALKQPADAARLVRWKRLELLRIAARDLLGLDRLEETGAALAVLADEVLAASAQLAGPPPGQLTVIGMGKLGGRELNYASDVDILFVGDADPRPLLAIARRAWRVDLDLRPEGRSGPLIRSLESYIAYWDRWADTWEFQALIKARPVAGDAGLGARFMAAAGEQVWGRPFGADELRAVRAMKARAEGLVSRRGDPDRELKLGPGGIRDIEFAVQLLQLVHGRADPGLRSRTTLTALDDLAVAGYVARADAHALIAAYRFLRAAEHRLQLVEDRQVHALPSDLAARTRLARVMGFRDQAGETALGQFEDELRRHQSAVRSIHERLFFRPLLEVFTRSRRDHAPAEVGLSEQAAAERLAAFGFSDADRTRQAVEQLTRGFSRASRLMQQLLPLLFEWLSEAPDPDLGLLGLRSLSTGQHRRDQLLTLFRESPEAARRLCLLLGTSGQFRRGFERHPELLSDLAGDGGVVARSRDELLAYTKRSLSWRGEVDERRHALEQLRQVEWLRVAAGDVLGLTDVSGTERGLTALAEAVLQTALHEVGPPIPFAIVALGRLGGAELTYASDLDVLFVFDGDQRATASAAESAAELLLRYLNGDTPANRLWTVDMALRPEGRQGPLARSLAAYQTYYERWARLWERQALLRGRVVAGDADVGRRFLDIAQAFVWDAHLRSDEVREIRRMKARIEHERIPVGEDPQFHLKLGRGSLSDIEWTAQLLQWQHGIGAEGTMAALDALSHAGAISESDATVLADAYRFCEQTRNRLYLVRGGPGDALPSTGPVLTRLARSLGTTPSGLREEYRRRTRRCRQVVERLFYGRASG